MWEGKSRRVCVCVVGRSEFASDGVIKNVLEYAPAAQRRRCTSRMPVKLFGFYDPHFVSNVDGLSGDDFLEAK